MPACSDASLSDNYLSDECLRWSACERCMSTSLGSAASYLLSNGVVRHGRYYITCSLQHCQDRQEGLLVLHELGQVLLHVLMLYSLDCRPSSAQ